MGVGLTVAAVGFGLLTQVEGDSGLALVVSGSFVFLLGYGPVFALTNDLILSTAPPQRAGAVSGISETGTELGGALGIAVLGSIGTAVHRGDIARAVPAGVPAEAADAARDTLGGAVGVADQLPAELLSAAVEAFASGLRLAAGLSVAVMVGLAVLVVWVLRRERAGAESNPAERELAGAQPA